MPRPAARERQPAEAAEDFAEQAEPENEQRHRDRVKFRPRREEAPRGEPRAHRRGRQMPLEFALAPVAHQVGQRNAHRADFLAAPAEGRGVRQVAGVLDADDARRQHRAHRPRIDPAIGVPADRRVDRAMVHAGAAADAAQHLAELAAEHRGAAVVENDDVIFGRARPDRRRGAGRSRASCRPTFPARSPSARARAGTATRPRASAPPSRSTPARCARAASVCVRSPLPSLVTMIEVPVSATRKFAPVMPTSAERNRSRRITRASVSSVCGSTRLAVGRQMRVHAAEVRLDLLLGEMHRRHDDVRGQLVADLHQIFAEVRLDRRDAVRFEEIVDRDLLADHRLALGDELRVRLAADLQHLRARFVGRHGVMHVAAGRDAALLELFEIEIEMRERVVLDVARAVAQRVELGELGDDRAAAVHDAGLDAVQRALQLRIGERFPGVLLERRRGQMRDAHRSPIAGSVMPASTSATWRACDRLAEPLQPARHVHQAAEIAREQRAGAGRRDVLGLLGDDGVGDVGIFDAERAAEAAAHIGVVHLLQRRAPARSASSLRGCALMPSSRRPEQLS